MDYMKSDMAGAATVLGIIKAATQLKIKSRIVGIIPAAENMPGPSAFKPGDVITAYNKKTIEIGNTDAEGRLLLADALTFAEEQKPSMIVDLATLTGACHIALGDFATGAFTNNQDNALDGIARQ